jgi:polysaccharide export outer membrane protein
MAYIDKVALAEFEAEAEPVYRLGEGDHLDLQVWNRPELSGKHVVGPDGRITIPLLGPMKVAAMTREEAADHIKGQLNSFYLQPIVTLGVEQYLGNRVTVLGRVASPGIMQFDRPPLLLEVLARAGTMPMLDKQVTLTRCAIFRGREKIIWVDLKTLLNRGDLAYNIRLKPNDLVYIPDSSETMVYVMGAVDKPGAYRLTPDMSYLDALAQAGGPTEDADVDQLSLYRPGRDAAQVITLKSLLTEGRRVNVGLEEGDIIYAPKRGIANVGYVMRQLLPGLSFMTFVSPPTTSTKK